MFVLVLTLAGATGKAAEPIAAIPRLLPPEGIALDPAVRESLEKQLQQLQERFAKLPDEPMFSPDVEVLLDALDMALKFGEFYDEKDIEIAREVLGTAAERVAASEANESPWVVDHGLTVRAYRSSVDGTAQPFGLVIPEREDREIPVPLYVWLHGRGDKQTNLRFIHERLTKVGQIAPPGAIVLHPFGRHCLGFKSAGEIDVLEAVERVAYLYNIDRDRIVLMGFSMGGAGCWHLGAHYPDRWVAMSPGAGFAETAQYQSLNPDQVPPYERTLWGVYDVPEYVRNLFNLPVIAYSGENDKQIQAARVMEAAFAAEGQTLDHRIGPGMGHKYHPDVLAAILKDLNAAVERGRETPSHVSLQTRTLRYHKVHWVNVLRLNEHWQDTRVEAESSPDGSLRVTTTNVAALQLHTPYGGSSASIVIDTQPLTAAVPVPGIISLVQRAGRWSVGEPDGTVPAKRPGLQGPIDDAFLEPFLVVTPGGTSPHPQVQRWVEFELPRFLDRWEGVFRGRPRVKPDSEVTEEDLAKYHLVLWGDPASNSVLGRISDRLPIDWKNDEINVGKDSFPAAGHVVTMIYPNPEAPAKYVVLNGGPTFREGHDRTNSLQNPKLPDWAVIDLSQPPDGLTPGRIAAADFFDEAWQLRDRSSRD